MAEVVWRRSALQDLIEIAAYIRQFDPKAADEYERALTALGESLSTFPNRGRPAVDGMRELVTVPPYVLGYRVLGDQVQIVSVRHGRQQPRKHR